MAERNPDSEIKASIAALRKADPEIVAKKISALLETQASEVVPQAEIPLDPDPFAVDPFAEDPFAVSPPSQETSLDSSEQSPEPQAVPTAITAEILAQKRKEIFSAKAGDKKELQNEYATMRAEYIAAETDRFLEQRIAETNDEIQKMHKEKNIAAKSWGMIMEKYRWLGDMNLMRFNKTEGTAGDIVRALEKKTLGKILLRVGSFRTALSVALLGGSVFVGGAAGAGALYGVRKGMQFLGGYAIGHDVLNALSIATEEKKGWLQTLTPEQIVNLTEDDLAGGIAMIEARAALDGKMIEETKYLEQYKALAAEVQQRIEDNAEVMEEYIQDQTKITDEQLGKMISQLKDERGMHVAGGIAVGAIAALLGPLFEKLTGGHSADIPQTSAVPIEAKTLPTLPMEEIAEQKPAVLEVKAPAVPVVPIEAPEPVGPTILETETIGKGEGVLHALERMKDGDEVLKAMSKTEFRAWKMDQLEELGFKWINGKLAYPFTVHEGAEMRLFRDPAGELHVRLMDNGKVTLEDHLFVKEQGGRVPVDLQNEANQAGKNLQEFQKALTDAPQETLKHITSGEKSITNFISEKGGLADMDIQVDTDKGVVFLNDKTPIDVGGSNSGGIHVERTTYADGKTAGWHLVDVDQSPIREARALASEAGSGRVPTELVRESSPFFEDFGKNAKEIAARETTRFSPPYEGARPDQGVGRGLGGGQNEIVKNGAGTKAELPTFRDNVPDRLRVMETTPSSPPYEGARPDLASGGEGGGSTADIDTYEEMKEAIEASNWSDADKIVGKRYATLLDFQGDIIGYADGSNSVSNMMNSIYQTTYGTVAESSEIQNAADRLTQQYRDIRQEFSRSLTEQNSLDNTIANKIKNFGYAHGREFNPKLPYAFESSPGARQRVFEEYQEIFKRKAITPMLDSIHVKNASE